MTTKNATRKDKKMSATTTAAYYYLCFPPDGFELGTNVGKKLRDSLMGKCLAQHLELQMESHLELMKELAGFFRWLL